MGDPCPIKNAGIVGVSIAFIYPFSVIAVCFCNYGTISRTGSFRVPFFSTGKLAFLWYYYDK
jgi:hypothetical protein